MYSNSGWVANILEVFPIREYSLLMSASEISFYGIMVQMQEPGLARYLIEFIAASSQHTFKFTNWGHICPTCTELILDDVRLYVIEELSPIIPPCPTGVNSVDANLNFKIYPNPVLNQLTISSEVTETFSFRLFDLTSRKIIEKQIHGSEVINLPNMKSGLYFYEVSNGKGMLQQGKIVKE